ncbi:hypothetical protein ACFQU7_43565 [Pseudoroseomonas wenyumeiae]
MAQLLNIHDVLREPFRTFAHTVLELCQNNVSLNTHDADCSGAIAAAPAAMTLTLLFGCQSDSLSIAEQPGKYRFLLPFGTCKDPYTRLKGRRAE